MLIVLDLPPGAEVEILRNENGRLILQPKSQSHFTKAVSVRTAQVQSLEEFDAEIENGLPFKTSKDVYIAGGGGTITTY